MDITDIILEQHAQQRRMFALLDHLEPDNHEALEAVWNRLCDFLEVHARAEELYFYPELLKVGSGCGGQESAASETKDAIKDHNEIRSAIAEVANHRVGSKRWWSAVLEARIANDDHMAEEEREDLPDFRRHADLQLRHSVAVKFLVFEASHPNGIQAANPDPDRWVRGQSKHESS